MIFANDTEIFIRIRVLVNDTFFTIYQSFYDHGWTVYEDVSNELKFWNDF